MFVFVCFSTLFLIFVGVWKPFEASFDSKGLCFWGFSIVEGLANRDQCCFYVFLKQKNDLLYTSCECEFSLTFEPFFAKVRGSCWKYTCLPFAMLSIDGMLLVCFLLCEAGGQLMWHRQCLKLKCWWALLVGLHTEAILWSYLLVTEVTCSQWFFAWPFARRGGVFKHPKQIDR